MVQVTNESGKRYGRLGVLGRDGSRNGAATWWCQCECGQSVSIRGAKLRSGGTRSCGCQMGRRELGSSWNFIDETGNRHGKLVVIERAPHSSLQAHWRCQCDCGKELVIKGTNLRHAQEASCGCTRRLPDGEAAFNQLFYSRKKQAGYRDLEWAITKEEFRALTEQACHYCGVEPSYVFDRGHNTGTYVYNGLDRVDNSRGYVAGNVVACCGTCNMAKRDMTQAMLRQWVSRVYQHYCA